MTTPPPTETFNFPETALTQIKNENSTGLTRFHRINRIRTKENRKMKTIGFTRFTGLDQSKNRVEVGVV
jgi:hypothetical protein